MVERHVFVSYAHHDAKIVSSHVNWLRTHGLNLWLDGAIPPGTEWNEEIANATADARALIYFVTQHSVASKNCRNEIQFAQSRNIPIYPVFLESVTLPAGLDLSLGLHQALYLYRDPDAGLTSLLNTLSVPRENVPEPIQQPARKYTTKVGIGIGLLLAVLAAFFYLDPRQIDDGLATAVAVLPTATPNADPRLEVFSNELAQNLVEYPELDVSFAGNLEPTYLVASRVIQYGEQSTIDLQIVFAPDNRPVLTTNIPLPNVSRETVAAQGIAAARLARQVIEKDLACVALKEEAGSTAAQHTCAALNEGFDAVIGGDMDTEYMVSNLERSIETQDDLAISYVVLAATLLTNLGGRFSIEEINHRAREAIAAAESLDPNNPIVITARGRIESELDFNMSAAEASFRKAVDADPLNHRGVTWLGGLHEYHGNLQSAITEYRRALSIDESVPITYRDLANALNSSGSPTEALAIAEEGLSLAPGGIWRCLLMSEVVEARLALDQKEEARQAVQDAIATVSPNTFSICSSMRARLGDTEASTQTLQNLLSRSSVPVGAVVRLSAALQNKDIAFEWMHVAVEQRDWNIIKGIRTDPLFDSMRQDPRWREVEEKLSYEETACSLCPKNSSIQE